MRTNKAALNSSMAIVQKIIDTILSFVYRTIFIAIMGATYLGVNGLLSNIFIVMSLAELGIGSTIIYLLYEPLTKNDEENIRCLMKIFAKMYNFVGIFIFLIGIILVPFLPYLINNNGQEIVGLVPIYLLMLANTSFVYFFAYKRSLLDADQKGYYNSLNTSLFSIISNVAKIVILLITKNFILTLVAAVVITLLSNVAISIKANKIYPFLKDKSPAKVSKQTKITIFKRMKAVFIHNISNVILTGTDNLLISKFINIVAVGIYSNYTMITNTIYGIFTMIFVALTSSVGNMKVSETNKRSEEIFNRLLLSNFYLYFVTCIVLWCCFAPFIKLWIGDDYLLSTAITALVILSLYISGMRHVPVTFVNASGLNYNTRYKSVAEAILNLVLSLILVNYFGIFGVILGTIISLLCCSVIVEPYILYKHWFKQSPFKFYRKYIIYLFLTIIVALGSGYICNLINISNFGGLMLKGLISFSIANIVFILVYYKNNDFKFYIDYFISTLKKVISKITHQKN